MKQPRWMRQFVLLCLLLWLPFQGYAATLMPFCSHAQQHQQNQEHLHQLPDADHVQKHHSPASDANHACDDCSLCHMCGALALPSLISDLQAVFNQPYGLQAPQGFSPHYPEQPQRPPLAGRA